VIYSCEERPRASKVAGVLVAIAVGCAPAWADFTKEKRLVARIDPPALYLMKRAGRPFLEEREALMEAVLQAGDEPPERARALTDLAEFHFAHGFMTEGLSLLSDLDDTALPTAHRLRAAALELAMGLTNPVDRPLTDRASALLTHDTHGKWPEAPLMRALSYLRTGDCATAQADLEDAAKRLHRYPDPVRELVLPPLLDCAIESEAWPVARDLAEAFETLPTLKGSAALHYPLGKVAEAGGDTLAAFDHYALAQDGRDLWAHRARRALVDLGLREEALSVERAVALLEQETEQWRGDEAGAETLDRLAELQVTANDLASAVVTYGRLIQRHAGSPAAKGAQQKAGTLIDALYAPATAEDARLSQLMDWHKRIAPFYRFVYSFSLASERFADRFREAGATAAASREYATIRDHLTAADDLGIFSVPVNQIDRLSVKEAEALLEGGQFDALGALLAQPIEPEDADLARRMALVRAQYFDETGQRAALLKATDLSTSDKVLRLRAQAFFQQENWPAARVSYAQLADRLGAETPLPDAIRYLLAAHRSGDRDTVAQVVQQFAGLTELPQWTEIAQTLSLDAPTLLPLRNETARARIEKAQDTLDTLGDPGKSVN